MSLKSLNLVKFSASFRGKSGTDKALQDFGEDNLLSVNVTKVEVQSKAKANAGKTRATKLKAKASGSTFESQGPSPTIVGEAINNVPLKKKSSNIVAQRLKSTEEVGAGTNASGYNLKANLKKKQSGIPPARLTSSKDDSSSPKQEKIKQDGEGITGNVKELGRLEKSASMGVASVASKGAGAMSTRAGKSLRAKSRAGAAGVLVSKVSRVAAKNMSMKNLASARKSVSSSLRKFSNVSFMGGIGLSREVALFEVQVTGKKGNYTIKKEHKHFKKLHDSLKSKFPQVKKMVKTFPRVGYFSIPEEHVLEQHKEFFQKYLQTLMKLKPRPADLNKFLDLRNHTMELKGKKRTGFNSLEDFELMKRIGEGSFGTVYLVRAVETNEIFAMKVLKKEELRKKQQVEHTLTEMKVMSVSDHPFIVALKFAFHTEDRLFMVIQYCPGGELFFYLKTKRVLSEDAVRFYSAEIGLALSYLHERDILYRDLKPENILMDGQGHVLLTDFGLSRENCKGEHDAKTFCGTPEYLSPEMLIHRETREGYGKGVDWWSLGILIYEMLFGLPPFYHKNLKKMCERILHRKLSFPDRKIKSTADVKDLIKGLLNRKVKARLGVTGEGFNEIKTHPFYSTLDWEALFRKELPPPFKPQISSDPFNVDNFDSEFTSKPAKLSFDEKSRRKTRAKSKITEADDEFENFDYSFFEKKQHEVINEFYE